MWITKNPLWNINVNKTHAKRSEWFTLTDEVIDLIGYKSSESNKNRKSLLRFIRKNFKEGRDFSEVRVGTAKSGSGGHNRLEIQMTKFPFKKMLLKVGTAMSEAIHDCLLFSFSLLYIHKMLFYKRRCFLNRHNQFSELHFSRKFGIPHQNHVSLFQRKTNTTRKIF